MLPTNFPYRRELRLKDATERKSLSDSLTAEQRLLVLDTRLGKGQGAVRERLRLQKSTKVEEQVVNEVKETKKIKKSKK